jgi:hypothetical protein
MEDSGIRKEIRSIWKQFEELTKIININKSESVDKRNTDFIGITNRLSSLETDVKIIGDRQSDARERLKNLEKHCEELDKTFVTKSEYAVVKYIVNTIVGLFVVGIVTSLIRLILPHSDFTQ